MENDLISRSALTERIVDLLVFHWGYEGVEADVKQIFNEIPAVDAVEVVRCAECNHSRERNEYEKAYLVEGVRVCTHPECSGDCWYATWNDHWCSYGERRGDHEDS